MGREPLPERPAVQQLLLPEALLSTLGKRKRGEDSDQEDEGNGEGNSQSESEAESDDSMEKMEKEFPGYRAHQESLDQGSEVTGKSQISSLVLNIYANPIISNQLQELSQKNNWANRKEHVSSMGNTAR